jgi:hypothetical protein
MVSQHLKRGFLGLVKNTINRSYSAGGGGGW